MYVSVFRPVWSDKNRAALFQRLSIELYGDRASTFDLCAAFSQAEQYNTNQPTKQSVDKAFNSDEKIDNNGSNNGATNTKGGTNSASSNGNNNNNSAANGLSNNVNSNKDDDRNNGNKDESNNSWSDNDDSDANLKTLLPLLLPLPPSYYTSIKLNGPAMKKMNKFVNKLVSSQFAMTYGHFISFTDPILLDSHVDAILKVHKHF